MFKITIRSRLFRTAVFFLIFCCCMDARAQRSKADSLRALIETDRSDTNQVRYRWQLAIQLYNSKPDTAQSLAQEALFLARYLHDEEGESRALGALASTLTKIGNYTKALELNIERLQLEEKRKNPRTYAGVLNNIGVVYDLEEEYLNALAYFKKSDSVIAENHFTDYEYYGALNLGDVYNRLNRPDSAYYYFIRSLKLAGEDIGFRGSSYTGLGHSYLKLGKTTESRDSYLQAIGDLTTAGDDETRCEALLGLAALYRKTGQPDSAGYYARASLRLALDDGFTSKELDAVSFLTEHFKQVRDLDSAFFYVDYLHRLNDSLNSKARIRETQVITSNEQLRQAELAEKKKLDEKERFSQLQMLLIAIFIPGFFLITLLLTRVKVHTQAVRILGILSLLFLFEYLTLLLHPRVAAFTHHTPVFEILIFVAIAAILIPAHHKIEHWLVHRLLHLHHHHHEKRKIQEAAAAQESPEEKQA